MTHGIILDKQRKALKIVETHIHNQINYVARVSFGATCIQWHIGLLFSYFKRAAVIFVLL